MIHLTAHREGKQGMGEMIPYRDHDSLLTFSYIMHIFSPLPLAVLKYVSLFSPTLLNLGHHERRLRFTPRKLPGGRDSTLASPAWSFREMIAHCLHSARRVGRTTGTGAKKLPQPKTPVECQVQNTRALCPSIADRISQSAVFNDTHFECELHVMIA